MRSNKRQSTKPKGLLVLRIEPNEWISIYDPNDGALPPIKIYGKPGERCTVGIQAPPNFKILRSDVAGGSQGSRQAISESCHGFSN